MRCAQILLDVARACPNLCDVSVCNVTMVSSICPIMPWKGVEDDIAVLVKHGPLTREKKAFEVGNLSSAVFAPSRALWGVHIDEDRNVCVK